MTDIKGDSKMTFDVEKNDTLRMIRDAITGTEFAGRVFVAGGFVRDFVMGRPSKDIDLVVNLPQGGIRLATLLKEKCGATDLHLFERFGTAQVVLNGEDVEMVMTRAETYTEGSRNPEVEFADLKADVMRRDFTINTLLINLMDGQVLDITGRGFADIEDGLIDVTVDSNVVFNDDPLRMLRAVRFMSQLNFRVSGYVMAGIRENVNKISFISKERIRDEFMKLLAGGNAVDAIRILVHTGLINCILPELRNMIGVDHGKYHIKDPFEHTMDVVSRVNDGDPVLVLVALLHDLGKPSTISFSDDGAHFYNHETKSAQIAREFLLRLKFPNDVVEDVVMMVANHMAFASSMEKPSAKHVRRVVRIFGDRDKFNRFMKLVGADMKPNPRVIRRDFNIVDEVFAILKRDDEAGVTVRAPVSGNDVMNAFGIPSGPEVGRLLSVANEAFLENPNLTKDELLAVMRGA
jgi:poly(A) polymerase